MFYKNSFNTFIQKRPKIQKLIQNRGYGWKSTEFSRLVYLLKILENGSNQTKYVALNIASKECPKITIFLAKNKVSGAVIIKGGEIPIMLAHPINSNLF